MLREAGKLQELYERYEGYTLLDRIERILNGQGIHEHRQKGTRNVTYNSKINTLSGGERKLIELAIILTQRGVDLLILDEPMAHLDAQARQTVEYELQNMNCAKLLISHDVHLLNKISTKIWTIENHSLTVIHGNYHKFYIYKQQQIKQIKHTWQQYKKNLKILEKKYKKFKLWVQKSQAPGIVTLYKRFKKLYEEALDNPPINPDQYMPHIKIQSFEPTRAGHILVRFSNTSFGYNFKLLQNINLTITTPTRAALVGPNGAGKSTLFKLILTKYVKVHSDEDPQKLGIGTFYRKYHKHPLVNTIYRSKCQNIVLLTTTH